MNATAPTIDPGSFRDPSGCVFFNDGKVFRSIFPIGATDYEAARDAGIYPKLIQAGFFLPHEQVDGTGFAPPETVYCLSHPRIPMISYPWEWPFSLLKDAALHTLGAAEMLLPEGFWLRDASAFNVQYDGTGLRLIDTLSIGRRTADSPWPAYAQFCAHFLAPLAVAAYSDIRTLGLWRNFINGYPLDLAVRLLPFWRRIHPRLVAHLTLHALFQQTADKSTMVKSGRPKYRPRVTDTGLIGLIRSLKRSAAALNWRQSSRIWERYGDIRTYNAADVALKTDYVQRVVGNLRPGTVWDLGANTGEFSLVAASHGAFVVRIEGDPVCTERFYKDLQAKGITNILPLTMDLSNPSPALGWDHSERFSLRSRGPADLVLVLALIHHLVYTSSIPLPLIARWLAELCRHAVVEFMPPEDPMVRKLVANRGYDRLPYDLAEFDTAFGRFFTVEDRSTLNNGRILYLFKRKHAG